MEAAKRIDASDKLKVIEKALKKKDDAAKESNNTLLHFVIWVGAGMKVDTRIGYPKLSKEASVAIVKVLLPGINPWAKSNDYKTMGACVKWLQELAGGTTWRDEMKSYDANMQETYPVTASLF